MNYQTFYRFITAPVRKYPILEKSIVLVNRLITTLFYLIYPLFLVSLFFTNPYYIWKAMLVPAGGFVVLSLLRKWIGRARPYQKWDIQPCIAKDSLNNSFPSRHVYSAMMIALTIMPVYHIVGVILLAFALLEGILRVLGGVHYPSDVLAGMLMAVVFSVFLSR